MSDAVKIVGLEKSFGDNHILRDLKLTVKKGEMIGIAGKSGAGKTTLLRIINLLETYDSGSLSILGKEIPVKGKEALDLRRSMMMVFQKPIMLNASVKVNLEFGLRLRDIEPGDEVENAVAELGIKDKLNLSATKLSGGEAQRVALAQFILLKPQLLLLDEPTANLDSENVMLVEKLIKGLRDKGSTVIIATHDAAHARRLCDKVYTLKDGRLK